MQGPDTEPVAMGTYTGSAICQGKKTDSSKASNGVSMKMRGTGTPNFPDQPGAAIGR